MRLTMARNPSGVDNRQGKTRSIENRDSSVNYLTNAEIDDLVQRLAGRWVLVCLKQWITALVAIVTGSWPFWLPPLWKIITGGGAH